MRDHSTNYFSPEAQVDALSPCALPRDISSSILIESRERSRHGRIARVAGQGRKTELNNSICVSRSIIKSVRKVQHCIPRGEITAGLLSFSMSSEGKLISVGEVGVLAFCAPGVQLLQFRDGRRFDVCPVALAADTTATRQGICFSTIVSADGSPYRPGPPRTDIIQHRALPKFAHLQSSPEGLDTLPQSLLPAIRFPHSLIMCCH